MRRFYANLRPVEYDLETKEFAASDWKAVH